MLPTSGARRFSFLLLSVSFFLLLIAPLIAAAAQQNLQLSVSPAVSQEGFLTLSWSGDSAIAPASLELAEDEHFLRIVRTVPLNSQVLEKGQVHISGLRDGDYQARLVSGNYESLSNVALLQVQHRDLGTALWIFALGALLFVVLVAMVIRFSTGATD